MSLWVLVKMLNATSVERAGTTDDTMNLPGKINPKRFVYWLLYSHDRAFKRHEMLITCSYFYIFFRKCAIFSFSFSFFQLRFIWSRFSGAFVWRVTGPVRCSVLGLMAPASPVFLILPVICDLHSVFWGECVRKLCWSQITGLDPQRVH